MPKLSRADSYGTPFLSMVQPDKTTFLGKLARFVSNPTTDWTALDSGQSTMPPDTATLEPRRGAPLTQADIAQLQHQRRKRNRRIREKEFAMLRQIQAGAHVPGVQGDLSSGQAGGSTLPMPAQPHATQRPTGIAGFDVNKIDNIEQQMVNQWWDKDGAMAAQELPDTMLKTQIMIEAELPAASDPLQNDALIQFDPAFLSPPVSPHAQQGEFRPMRDSAQANGTGEQVNLSGSDQSGGAPFQYDNPPTQLHDDFQPAQRPLSQPPQAAPMSQDRHIMAESAELDAEIHQLQAHGYVPEAHAVHSVENLPDALNEAAILFSQKQTDEAHRRLRALADASIANLGQGEHAQPDALLALLDLYRATRQEEAFENASIELVQHFGRSAPQYRGADLGQATQLLSTLGVHMTAGQGEQGNWCAPAELDLMDVMLLRAQLVQQPAQLLLDWRPLHIILDDALEPLLDQLRDVASRKIEVLMWGGDHLLQCCVRQLELSGQSATTIALLWLLRLEMVRIMYGQEVFDNLALQYCVALEMSPPSWVRTRCKFIDADSAISLLEEELGVSTLTPATNIRGHLNHPRQWQGELVGSIQPLLQALQETSHDRHCLVDCLQLDRMDYTAVAELLRWLIAQEDGEREVHFINVHRLLAVFWRIMGITAKAKVDLRRD